MSWVKDSTDAGRKNAEQEAAILEEKKSAVDHYLQPFGEIIGKLITEVREEGFHTGGGGGNFVLIDLKELVQQPYLEKDRSKGSVAVYGTNWYIIFDKYGGTNILLFPDAALQTIRLRIADEHLPTRLESILVNTENVTEHVKRILSKIIEIRTQKDALGTYKTS